MFSTPQRRIDHSWLHFVKVLTFHYNLHSGKVYLNSALLSFALYAIRNCRLEWKVSFWVEGRGGGYRCRGRSEREGERWKDAQLLLFSFEMRISFRLFGDEICAEWWTDELLTQWKICSLFESFVVVVFFFHSSLAYFRFSNSHSLLCLYLRFFFITPQKHFVHVILKWCLWVDKYFGMLV